ncbi:MAG: hypothetical protein II885_04905 [Oscillospiraceae bacterium]|nr:hypothetical protein [Oscillospiraceae bacterium]
MASTYINNLFDFTPFDGKNLPIVSLFLIKIKWEAPDKRKRMDRRADFSPGEDEKSKASYVYVGISRQNQAKNTPARHVRQFVRCFPIKKRGPQKRSASQGLG